MTKVTQNAVDWWPASFDIVQEFLLKKRIHTCLNDFKKYRYSDLRLNKTFKWDTTVSCSSSGWKLPEVKGSPISNKKAMTSASSAYVATLRVLPCPISFLILKALYQGFQMSYQFFLIFGGIMFKIPQMFFQLLTFAKCL